MRDYGKDAWERLGKAVKRARQAKGLGKTADWVHAAGKSDKTLLGLERGEPRGDDTLQAVEQALGWPPGRTYRILDGHGFHALPDGRVVETSAAHLVVFDADSHEILGDISDSGIPWVTDPDGVAWRDTTDSELARFVEMAAYELLRRHPIDPVEDAPRDWDVVVAAGEAHRGAEEPPWPVRDAALAEGSSEEEPLAARRGKSKGQATRGAQDADAEDQQ